MKRNTAELKEKLIATGVEEIRTRGVDQLSIRTVAQRCGVTHGAPYRHPISTLKIRMYIFR